MTIQGDSEQSIGLQGEIKNDTRLKGKATPGTHTPCVEVPAGEIELPPDDDGKTAVMKPKPKKKLSRKAKKLLVVGEKIYDMFAGGMTWSEITSSENMNSPWMAAKRFATANDLPYPPEKRGEKSLADAVVDSVEMEDIPKEEAVEESTEEASIVPLAAMPPVLPTFKLYELAKYPHLEKTAVGHTHTLEFKVGHDVRQFGLQGEPTATEVLDIISRESRKI